MNNNNYFNGAYGNNTYGNGLQYGVPQPQNTNMVWTNALTPEEEKMIKQQFNNVLSLNISPEEKAISKCSHRDPASRRFTINPNADGSVTCTKCGETFNLTAGNLDIDEIKKVIGGAIDILQTTKMFYVDMTPEVIEAYFVIIPFLKLAPKLYEAAMQTLNKVDLNGNLTPNYQSNDVFRNMSTMFGRPGMGFQQPMMGQPYNNMQQPMYGAPYNNMQMQQPIFNNVPTPAGVNPFQIQPTNGYMQQQPMMGQPPQINMNVPNIAGAGTVDQQQSTSKEVVVENKNQPKVGETVQVSKQFNL